MRRRKSDLHARVNRNLPLEFDDVRLTSYAGLELGVGALIQRGGRAVAGMLTIATAGGS